MAAERGHSLSARYTRLIVLCAVPLILLVAGLALVQFRTERGRVLDDLRHHAEQHNQELEVVIRAAWDHVRQMRTWAEDFLSGRIPQYRSPLQGALAPTRRAPGDMAGSTGVFMDSIADTPLAERVGNLYGAQSLLSDRGANDPELDMALHLFTPMHLTHRVAPYLRWSYYFSARGDFITAYPYVPGSGFVGGLGYGTVETMVADLLELEVFQAGLPEHNTTRGGYWTAPYNDEFGAGQMISHGAPIYRDDAFVGIVATDILLSHLEERLEHDRPPLGWYWLVDSAGGILADSGPGAGSADPTRPTRVLPGILEPSRLPGLADGRSDRFFEMAGYQILVQRVGPAPFYLVHAVPDGELMGALLPRFLPQVVALLGLIATLIVAQQLLQRFYVRPAIALVDHLGAVAKGAVAHPPTLPKPWRPWLDLVTRTFDERRAYLDRLTESEARFHAAANSLADGLAIFDVDDRLVYCNQRFRELEVPSVAASIQLGRTYLQIIGAAMEKGAVFHPDMGPHFIQRRLAMRQKPFYSHEHRLADGRWVRVRENRMPDGGLVMLMSDVTDRRLAHEALRASEERYRGVVENQSDFIVRETPDGRFTFVNDAFCRFMGMTRDQILSPENRETRCLSDEDRERLREHLQSLTPQRPTAAIEVLAVRPDGRKSWVQRQDLGIFDAAGRLIEVQSVGRDVTDRRMAEDARRLSEERLAAFLNHAPVGMYLKDRDFRYVLMNPEMGKVFGRPADQMIGQRADAVFSGEEAEMIRRFDTEVLETGVPTVHEEYLPGLDAYTWSLVIRFPILGPDGEVTHIGGFDVDITPLKRTTEQLTQSERRFRTFAEAHPVPVAILRVKDGKVLFANPPTLEALGVTMEEFEEADKADYFATPEERARMLRALRSHVVDGLEVRLRRKDGSTFSTVMNARRLTFERQAAIVVSGTDLTERHRIEAEMERQRHALNQAEKLTALGSLLAGVAHELNNPLSVVVGYASMLKEGAKDEVTVRRAERLHAAAERCARIVRSFLAMARQRSPERRRVDANARIEAALEIMAYGLRTSGVEVVRDMCPDLPALFADEDQLDQVILNLLVNALHALQTIPGPRRLFVSSRLDGGMVLLEVADNGPGIPEDIRNRIFEPFFTTKPQGVGTGIGLSVCHGVLTAHGGSIAVADRPGGGALFTLRIPAAPAIPVSTPKPAVGLASRGRPLRVMVIDDEPDIVELVRDILTREGHTVVECFNGRDAMVKLAGVDPDLILADVRMPGLDGLAFYQLLAADMPHLVPRLVFVTGDMLSPTAQELTRDPRVSLMEKPVDPPQLVALVRQRSLSGAGLTSETVS